MGILRGEELVKAQREYNIDFSNRADEIINKATLKESIETVKCLGNVEGFEKEVTPCIEAAEMYLYNKVTDEEKKDALNGLCVMYDEYNDAHSFMHKYGDIIRKLLT